MRVLVCGSRGWREREPIRERVAELPPDALLIYGGAPGADEIAAAAALQRGLRLECVPADWGRYGRAAGPIRNRAMLDLNPDLVIAFRLRDGRSAGTDDTIAEAKRRGIPIEVYVGVRQR